eukprot:1403579-Amphidinium_carterae.1
MTARASYRADVGGKKLKAVGKGSFDLLVQHVTVSAIDPEGRVASVMCFSCPGLIGFGKSMEAMSAMMERCSGLGSVMACAQQITIRHQVHDAGMTAGLRDFVSGWWNQNNVQPVVDKESNED